MFINENYSSKFTTIFFWAPTPKFSAEISIPISYGYVTEFMLTF